MSALRAVYVRAEESPAVVLREKLAQSERERERLTCRLEAEQNLHAKGRAWDALFGVAVGALLTLLGIGIAGAI